MCYASKELVGSVIGRPLRNVLLKELRIMNLKQLAPELSFSPVFAESVSCFLFDEQWHLLDSQVGWEASEQGGSGSFGVRNFVDSFGCELQDLVCSQEAGEMVLGYIVLPGEMEALPVSYSWSRKTDAASGATFLLLVVRDCSHEQISHAWQECYKRRDSLRQFLRRLSHDLNNIIHPLSSSSVLLRRKLGDRNDLHDLLRCTHILDRGLERVGRFSEMLQAFSSEPTSHGASMSMRALRVGVTYQLERLFLNLPEIEWESDGTARELAVPEDIGVTLVSQFAECLLENGGVRVSERLLSRGHEDLPEGMPFHHYCEISIVSRPREGGSERLELPFGSQCPLALIRKQARLPEPLLAQLAKGYQGRIVSAGGLEKRSIFLPVVAAL